jgi:GT2 family glycosyltransferase
MMTADRRSFPLQTATVVPPAGVPVLMFSVVVPTYNRPSQMRRCLYALASLEYPRDRYEVIVVDDGGRRPVETVCRSFRDRLALRIVRTLHRGPAHARNTGVALSRARWVAFTDDDCRVAPDWLSRLEGGLLAFPGRLCGGRTLNLLARNPFSAASQMIVDLVYRFYNQNPANARFFASNNMAMDRRQFRSLGGFDPAFAIASEDRDFCDRWTAAGRGMVYCPLAVVGHAHSLSLSAYARQHFRYGRGACRYNRARRIRRSGSLASDVGFHFRLPRTVWRKLAGEPTVRVMVTLVLLVIWQIANLTGYLFESVDVPEHSRVRSRLPL